MVLASRIPSYETRLRCAQIMQTFDVDLDFTRSRLEIVEEAVKQVGFVKALALSSLSAESGGRRLAPHASTILCVRPERRRWGEGGGGYLDGSKG